MNKIQNITGSTLGGKISLRISRPIFDALKQEFIKDRENEQFAFGLCSQARTADGSILILRDIIFPDENDLGLHARAGVCPTRTFQAMVYLLARQRQLSIVDFHTHPFQDIPTFSCIDEAEGLKNAQAICRDFPWPRTQAMVVFDKNLTAHDACIYERSLHGYRNIDCLEILGRHTEIRPTGESPNNESTKDPVYSRQIIIPGWDQTTLAKLKVVIIGAGGNGAQIIQALVSMGVGTKGWIAAIDPDIIEASNLPRIPYATAVDVGNPKVTVAACYIYQKNRKVKFYPYPCSVNENVAKDRIKAANIIIGCGDNDGLRKICNEMAVRYQIPYIDLGCDIQIHTDCMKAGGQVRVILPGHNACLVCCNGFDASEAAMDLMDESQKAVHAARGYIRGSEQQATPSVANLNASIAQFGIAAFLSLVHGEQFGNWNYLHYDQFTGQTLTASTHREETCVVCGTYGILGASDEFEDNTDSPVWHPWNSDPSQPKMINIRNNQTNRKVV